MTAVRKYPKFGHKTNYLMFQQDHAPEMQEICMLFNFKCFTNEIRQNSNSCIKSSWTIKISKKFMDVIYGKPQTDG